MTIEELFKKDMSFKSVKLISLDEGRLEMEALVEECDTNPYGFAHGGYLFTLCDTAAGLIGYSLKSYVVTQQANINYIRSAKKGDALYIKGEALHDGRTSKVARIDIADEKGKLYCSASFTLFPVKGTDE